MAKDLATVTYIPHLDPTFQIFQNCTKQNQHQGPTVRVMTAWQMTSLGKPWGPNLSIQIMRILVQLMCYSLETQWGHSRRDNLQDAFLCYCTYFEGSSSVYDHVTLNNSLSLSMTSASLCLNCLCHSTIFSQTLHVETDTISIRGCGGDDLGGFSTLYYLHKHGEQGDKDIRASCH